MKKWLTIALIALSMTGISTAAFPLNGPVDEKNLDTVIIWTPNGNCSGKMRGKLVVTGGHCLYNHGALVSKVRVFTLQPIQELPVVHGGWDVTEKFKQIEPTITALTEKIHGEGRAATVQEAGILLKQSDGDVGAIILQRAVQNAPRWKFLFETTGFGDIVHRTKLLARDEQVSEDLYSRARMALETYLYFPANREVTIVATGTKSCQGNNQTSLAFYGCERDNPPLRRWAGFTMQPEIQQLTTTISLVTIAQNEPAPRRLLPGDSGAAVMRDDQGTNVLVGIASAVLTPVKTAMAPVTLPENIRFLLKMTDRAK